MVMGDPAVFSNGGPVASEISFRICGARHLLDAGRSALTKVLSVDRDVGATGPAVLPVARKNHPRDAGGRRINPNNAVQPAEYEEEPGMFKALARRTRRFASEDFSPAAPLA